MHTDRVVKVQYVTTRYTFKTNEKLIFVNIDKLS